MIEAGRGLLWMLQFKILFNKKTKNNDFNQLKVQNRMLRVIWVVKKLIKKIARGSFVLNFSFELQISSEKEKSCSSNNVDFAG